jgi:DNA repair protein RadD
VHKLRDFQCEAIEALRGNIRAGVRRLLLVAPTGAGKTTIAAAMIESALSKGGKILFLAHRKELIDQASSRLDGLGVPHGIIMANHHRDQPHRYVQVASVQTIIRRDLPFAPTLVFIDEAHRSRGESYRSVIEMCGNPVVVGLTATPVRTDGRGLGGDLFQVLVQCPPIKALIGMGYLVPPVTYSWKRPDLSGIGKQGGDYKQDELEIAVNKPQLVGDVVAEWKRIADGRQTVAFAVSVKHSMAICEEFLNAGVPACHLDGETPKQDREIILRRLAEGKVRVVSNCAVLTEGWDCPVVSCAIIARPTLSLALYLQMSGRALRTDPGKTDCIILDHGGCAHQHGLITSDREWTLDGAQKKKKSPGISTADDFKVCPKCGRVAELSDLQCPCGYVFSKRDAPKVVHRPGRLEKLGDGDVRYVSEAVRRGRYERLLWEQHTLNKKNGEPFSKGYAFMKYTSEAGDRPKRGWREEWCSKHLDLVASDKSRREVPTDGNIQHRTVFDLMNDNGFGLWLWQNKRIIKDPDISHLLEWLYSSRGEICGSFYDLFKEWRGEKCNKSECQQFLQTNRRSDDDQIALGFSAAIGEYQAFLKASAAERTHAAQ